VSPCIGRDASAATPLAPRVNARKLETRATSLGSTTQGLRVIPLDGALVVKAGLSSAHSYRSLTDLRMAQSACSRV
jgi:hypothetical protein